MTSVDLKPHFETMPPHARRSTGRTGIPPIVWPIGAMIVLLPVLVALVVMLVF